MTKSEIRKKYRRVYSRLDEKSRRLWCATEALAIKKGGVAMVHAATGIARSTIYAGIHELTHKRGRPRKRRHLKKSDGCIRKKGGGAKSLVNKTPGVLAALEGLVETEIKGNPQNPMRWTSKSLRKLSEQLKKQGYDVSHSTVGTLLKQAGYSLQLNRKEKEGKSVPDRNAQFQFINDQAKDFLDAGEPVISVDTKKKELIGEYKNGGKEYRKKGDPIKVNVHDFPDKEEGKVAPYGVYDIGKNKGWVGVGITNDTAEFAVNTIRSWWCKMGKKDYPKATKLMITADCGGSNGNRVRLWKVELQKLANEFDLEIHVCHFPPGTSKWNKIEHKMFSYISQNWRGVPLITQEAVVQLIGSTTTTKGLQIQAQIDYREYSKGKKITDKDLEKVLIIRNTFHGEWNYIISPAIVFEIG
jgi:transposase